MWDPSVMRQRECGGPQSLLSAPCLWPQHQGTPSWGTGGSLCKNLEAHRNVSCKELREGVRHQSCEGFWEERGVPGIPPERGRRGIPPARNWRCPDIPAALSWGGGVSDKEPGDPSRKRLGCMGVPLARNRGVPPPGTGREALRHLPCQKPGCRGCRMPGVPRPPRRCHPGTPLSLCPTLTVGRAVPCRGAAAGRTRGTPQRG